MTDILSLTPAEIRLASIKLGYPEYRGKQIQTWLYKGCRDFSNMKNLPADMRESLKEQYHLFEPKMLRQQKSADGSALKYLWELSDGATVETVMMKYHYGNSICISSQVGCRQGCAFCASTIGGLVRNLTAGEMVDEVLFTEMAAGEKTSNIVLMGIGEPLDNLDQVLRFLHLISNPEGRNIGLRHITLSTCGLIDGIDRLAKENLPITLSISLHAPEDEIRSKIMPSNRGIQPLLQACASYYKKTGRRVSFEYSMISGVNDSVQNAERLADHALQIGAHVNLIPLNYVEERKLKASSPAVIKKFRQTLEKRGVNVTVRRSLGGDIDASCGQLRRKQQREGKTVT